MAQVGESGMDAPCNLPQSPVACRKPEGCSGTSHDHDEIPIFTLEARQGLDDFAGRPEAQMTPLCAGVEQVLKEERCKP